MDWRYLISYFFGGAVLTNAIPHFVIGTMGRPFQTPFATPHGEGLSSSSVNVSWGTSNVAIGYWLLCRVGAYDLHSTIDVLVTLLGALLSGLFLARHMGRFYGGNTPLEAQAKSPKIERIS